MDLRSAVQPGIFFYITKSFFSFWILFYVTNI